MQSSKSYKESLVEAIEKLKGTIKIYEQEIEKNNHIIESANEKIADKSAPHYIRSCASESQKEKRKRNVNLEKIVRELRKYKEGLEHALFLYGVAQE